MNRSTLPFVSGIYGRVKNAVARFAPHQIRIERVTTDNDSPFVSSPFAEVCGAAGMKHKRTNVQGPRYARPASVRRPIPREDYRTTRRVAFSDFEAKVLAAGGNPVLMTEFREQGSAGATAFALDAVHLSGRALLCPK